MKFDLYFLNGDNYLKDIEDCFSNNLKFEKIFFIHNQENFDSFLEFDCSIYLEKVKDLKFEKFFYFHQSMILTNFLEKSEYSIINYDSNSINEIQNINLNNINIDENVIITQNLIITKTKTLQFCLLKTLNMFWDQNYISDIKKYIQYIFKSSGYNIVYL